MYAIALVDSKLVDFIAKVGNLRVGSDCDADSIDQIVSVFDYN